MNATDLKMNYNSPFPSRDWDDHRYPHSGVTVVTKR